MFTVEKIIKYDETEDMHLVKWQGYSNDENTWEPEGNLLLRNKTKKNDELH